MIDFLLNVFATLFVTVDPPGLAAMFLGLTAGMDGQARRRVAINATLFGAAILVFFALFGERLLALLGVSLAAFRIAGGLLLFWIAFEMLFDRRRERKSRQASHAMTADDVRNIAAFPIAIPLIAGPGAISATILAAAQAPDTAAYIAFLCVLGVALAITLAALLLADQISKRLGETGRIIVERLLGLILAALAVQFVADGTRAIITG